MAKRINPTNCLSGNNIINVPYFLYQVDIYQYTRNMASLLITRYYKTSQPLKLNHCKIKKYKNFSVVRYINLIGEPKQ
jgi:hypothetical protein